MEVDGWIPSLISSSCHSVVWKGIISVVEQCNSLKEFYLNNFQLKVGDGRRIRFWPDIWCQSACLKDEFPTLYRLSLDKEESLRILDDKKSTMGGWFFAFRRELYEWEKQELARLLDYLLEAPVVCPECVDRPIWSASSSGVLNVADLYRWGVDNAGATMSITKLIWLKYIPPKVQVFGWFLVGLLGKEELRPRNFYKNWG